jgi:hypothetical protein
LLERVKGLRSMLLGQEDPSAYGPESGKAFAAILKGEIPALEPLWLDAARLIIKGLPEWKGEPQQKAAAVEMLNRLAAAVHPQSHQPLSRGGCDRRSHWPPLR